ncbi:calcium-binding protein [Herbaspirillum sp. alder98]|uniref:calcium-binding protein n=1 Tax=Herbaspirillum sp. alder98 TaxID=2913096 RepID=UPI001CD88F00|nr:calcium-binding protein [Herbaspirillum sp. alder98]MCA1322841.1 calcium-binding protein [Herbaspirillum sp. alder98]
MATAPSPQANQGEKITGPVRVVMPDQGGSFQLNAPRGAVQKVQVVDVDLVLHMADGTKVVLAGGAMEAMDDKSKVKFSDSSADTGRLLDTVGKIPLAPNDQSKVLNSDPVAAQDRTATTDQYGPGQAAAGDRNAAPVSNDPISQLAKVIADNSHSVTNGAQIASVPTQPTAGDASTAAAQAAITASQNAPESSTPTRPVEVQLPPERPATTPSTVVTGPGSPTLSVNLVNLTTVTQVGDVLYGSGGTPQSASDGSNAVQFARQVINAGNDVHTIYASGNNNNSFIKVFNVKMGGDVTVLTLTVMGVPSDVTLLNGTNMGGGTYQITVTPGQTEFNLQFKYDTQLANSSNPVHSQFDLSFVTTLATSSGVLTLADTRHVAIKDATSSADLTYLDPATGDNVLIFPAQGVPHEVHAGNNSGVTIYGSNANDLLYGGTGNDIIYGGAGSSSFFQGGAGADQLIGSATGNNTASYAGSAQGVTIDLNTGVGTGGDAQGDQLTNIQNLIGSANNDTFVASSQANKFDGGTGGSDTVSYAHSASGVTVDLVNNVGSGGDAAGDTYVSIENVIGSTSNDTFIASLAANSFTGNGGTDTVSYALSTAGVTVNLKTNLGSGGFAAGDTYNGIQNFVGSAYDDTFVGNAAVNSFDGGSGGNDTVSYAGSTAAVTVNLVTGRGSNGDAAGDTYIRIQNVIGGDGNDTFVVGLDSKNFNGGGGTLNTVDYSGSSSAITANMLTNTVTRTFEPVNALTNIQKIVGSSYSDTFIGGTGTDIFDGGLAGSDTVDYSAGAAVTVDLFNGTGAGGNAQGDTLVHIQNVIGSTAGGNTFYASADANSFNGNSTTGNTVNYSHATGAVIVDLTNTRDNTLAQNFATGDTFTNIQNVVGSVYDDLIVATSQVNRIDGGLGNNTVSYERASAAVKVDLATNQGSLGDAAGDTYLNIQNAIGGAGDDILVGNASINKFDGGLGSNTVSYEHATASVKVNLATGQGISGDAAGDTYANIQNATGGLADDIIVASSAINAIDGGGGTGNTVSYENSSADVKVDLFLGQGFNNDAAGDTYTNIQNAQGGSGNDTFVGNGVANSFEGGTGSNTISYEHSNAAVKINLATGTGSLGDAAGDRYYNIQNAIGGLGNDTIVASAATNAIDGNGGVNTVSYENSSAAVKVNLATGQGLLGDALNDTYVRIQNVTGGAGNDILVGNADVNVIDGGLGNNTVSYESSTAAVTIDLKQAQGLAGDAAGDTYLNIQNATGGAGDDLIVGSSVVNVIKGGGGVNTVSYATSAAGVKVDLVNNIGTGGDADLDTYENIQKVIGSALDDTFVGNSQLNEFWGGAGTNTVSYEASNGAVTIDLGQQIGTAGDAAADIYHDIQNATGGGGNDIIIASSVINRIDGGGGNNTVSYENSTAAVKVNLFSNQGTLGDAAGDTYLNIQNAIGGSGDDIFVGNGVVNRFDGRGGSNTISYESSGSVTVDLSTGNGTAGDANGDVYTNIQNFLGGTSDDTIISGSAANVINGGGTSLHNRVSYEASTSAVIVNLNFTDGTGTSGGYAAGDKLSNIQDLTGSSFDDIFVASAAANRFDGGTSTAGSHNRVSYAASNAAVTVDLNYTDGFNTSGGYADGDTLVNIQDLTGSAYNDLFIANSASNNFDGGAGSNTVSYAASTGAVTVNLSPTVGTGASGYAAGDTFTNIQNVIGSAYADTLIGYATVGVSSLLTGGAGGDTLVGVAANRAYTTASYAGSSAGVTINLNYADGTGTSGGDAAGDRLSFIDNLIGSSFNDTFVANAQGNSFDGGAGIDTVSYAASTSAVTVDLSVTDGSGTSGGYAAGDRFVNIENLIGSGFDDFLKGAAGGNSVITGGAGADTITGVGTGNYASYAGSGAGVNIDLRTGVGTGGDAQGDQLINIYNVIGSSYNDTFIASSQANVFVGGGGVDTVSYIGSNAGVTVDLSNTTGANTSGGYANGDSFNGISNIIGSSSNDTFYASSVANFFDGGGGINTVNYARSNAGVTVDLFHNTGANGYAAGDTYLNIQNAVGSSSNDLFVANGVANVFTGNGGSDTVSYQYSSSGSIVANLTTGTGSGAGDSNGDSYFGISNLIGSGDTTTSNTLTGNGGSNTLTVLGNNTSNTLNGGGAVTDTSQTDVFNAQYGGSNTLVGGTGTNIFNVSAGGTTGITNKATHTSNLVSANGSSGISTLHFEDLGSTLNLSTFSNKVSGITTLDVSTSTNTNMLVSYSDIQKMGVNNILTIKMTASESIQIDSSVTQYYLIFGNGDYAFYNDANHTTEIARIHVQLTA